MKAKSEQLRNAEINRKENATTHFSRAFEDRYDLSEEGKNNSSKNEEEVQRVLFNKRCKTASNRKFQPETYSIRSSLSIVTPISTLSFLLSMLDNASSLNQVLNDTVSGNWMNSLTETAPSDP